MRNVNKKIKRRDKKIEKLFSENSKLQHHLNIQENIAKKIKQKYKQLSCKANYYKKCKTDKLCNISSSTDCESKLAPTSSRLLLQKRVEHLENENAFLQERVEKLLTEHVPTFADGKYTDTVREVYALLLYLNIGTESVD